MINNLKFLHLIMMYFEFYISIEVGSKLPLDSKMLAYNYLTNIFFYIFISTWFFFIYMINVYSSLLGMFYLIYLIIHVH